MTAALFGKLPAKRDFVSRQVPQGFLGVMEPWLHEALAVSRQSMGPSWPDAYLAAPIWRFWMPPGLTGSGVVGAMMPSVDGVGRYFPLIIVASAPEGTGFAHPSYEPHVAWFDAVEGMLLGALEEGATLDMLLAWLGRLRDPPVGEASELIAPEDRDRVRVPHVQPLGPGLHRLRRSPPPPYTGTAWWTMGGVDFPAMALAWDGMPDTGFFKTMIAPPSPPAPAAGGPPAAAPPATGAGAAL